MSPQQRREQLVAIGVSSLATRQLEDITIEDLAAQAGVSRALVFYYFGSKTGLHHEIVRTARDGMLHATEPRPELPPRERLHDTLVRIVRFAREYRTTFFSLVRGAASGDNTVRDIVEEVRTAQTERVAAVFRELGLADTPLLAIALRSWVALAEQTLVDGALGTELSTEDLVGFLERSLAGVIAAIDEPAELVPSPSL